MLIFKVGDLDLKYSSYILITPTTHIMQKLSQKYPYTTLLLPTHTHVIIGKKVLYVWVSNSIFDLGIKDN
jgi:hypothetical protein